MADTTETPGITVRPSLTADLLDRIGRSAEHVVIPLLALIVSGCLFSLFLLALGKSPVDFLSLVWRGGFGTSFSWQNTLVRSAPLIFTALCVAIPARLGLVIIGGEGALVLGGSPPAAIAIPMIDWAPGFLLLGVMALAAMVAGGLWIGCVGALRHYRGVNETIASLLMFYIAVSILNFFVEGALRDPSDPNKPSTRPIGSDNMIGAIPGTDVHWGLPVGVVLCVLLYLLMNRTTFGFAAQIAGGNLRAAQAQGLPVGRLVVVSCALAGACAGLTGFFEVAAIHGKANASLIAGYGFTGILVSFLARHNPLVIVPVAIFLGGIAASGGLIQRRMDLPDATVLVLQGLLFLVILVSETFYGRFSIFKPGSRTR
ncbi:ABC transporter permease [Roseibium sp.]|uniref:ABC transporter permease n=1 Tax=Roseibium sp. TaxID=1936156 RepID=UPI00329A65BE